MRFYGAYINLKHRTDRNDHMKAELDRVGIKADRVEGMLPDEYTGDPAKVEKMRRRTPGAIGCHYSQVKVMQRAFERGENALVMEDDLVFCKDFRIRMKIIERFCESNPWDVFWLGGCYHIKPQWHKKNHLGNEIQGLCDCTLGRDWEKTDNKQIRRTYGCWSTHCYIVNKDSLERILLMLEINVQDSNGIDTEFIFLQPKLYTYAFNPGCVKQYDNQSDIGHAITKYSNFSHLGKHWYADYM